MTTHSENTATIKFPLEKVYKALSSKDYWEFETKNIGDEPGEVHSFTEQPVEAVLYELLPKAALPEAVRAMVSQDLKLKRVASFNEPVDNVATGTVTGDIKGAPVSFNSDVTLSGEGETTILKAESAIEVKIPMMGPVLEPKVAGFVDEFLAREASMIEQWIGENL
ncbi:DUF2505 domain-containing protein [Corynebacterium falsenii]|uniref:DUF2505 domain-containing protein n=1 Tax=Corynebacterium falsenii TaxID=108486 RepID=UPI00234D70F7|nr:DUF2505 domain-containing protein [Corynebacterium falsenii]MDC7103270.1 DUF2505 domain-containing protein [Corynebacterium falsenii]